MRSPAAWRLRACQAVTIAWPALRAAPAMWAATPAWRPRPKSGPGSKWPLQR